MASISANLVVSAATRIALPPACSISACTADSAVRSLPCTATAAPRCANRKAIAAPIPRELPVTSATLPSRRLIWPIMAHIRLHNFFKSLPHHGRVARPARRADGGARITSGRNTWLTPVLSALVMGALGGGGPASRDLPVLLAAPSPAGVPRVRHVPREAPAVYPG